VLAHNLIRHVAYLGEITPAGTMVVGSNLCTRFISIPGRLVNRSGRLVFAPWRANPGPRRSSALSIF
jgi:hypothetical protein